MGGNLNQLKLFIIFFIFIGGWAFAEKPSCQRALTYNDFLVFNYSEAPFNVRPEFKARLRKLITDKIIKELGYEPSAQERKKILRQWDREDKNVYFSYTSRNCHELKKNVFFELTEMQTKAIDELCEWVAESPKNTLRIGRFSTKYPHQYVNRGRNYVAFPYHYMLYERLEAEDVFHELRHAKDYSENFEHKWKALEKYTGLSTYFLERRAVREQKIRSLEFKRKDYKKAQGIKIGEYDFDHMYIYPFEEALVNLLDDGVDLDKIVDKIDYYLKSLDETYDEQRFSLDSTFIMENNLDRFPVLKEPEGEFLVILLEGLYKVKIYKNYVQKSKSGRINIKLRQLLLSTSDWRILAENYDFKTKENDLLKLEKIILAIKERFPRFQK